MSDFTATVTADLAGERLDRVLPVLIDELSRTYGQQLIEAGHVLLNGQAACASQKLRVGDTLHVFVPDPEPTGIEPEAIDLGVVYEDDEVIVVNKPAGLVVHPSPGHTSGTLVNALLAHTNRLSLHGDIRPGIVHRLDKDTSGLLVVARTDAAHANLVRQHQAHSMTKEYLGLVRGEPRPPVGLIDAPIGRDPRHRKRQAVVASGRAARTRFATEAKYPGITLLRLGLETGRTHQIRVHLAYIGHPVMGDPVYGAQTVGRARALGLERQFLHATTLAFNLPGSKKRVTFTSPLPPDLAAVLSRIKI